MSHFIRSGNTFKVFPGNSLDIQESLPVGNYTVRFNPMEGFSLEEVEPFRMPGKVYGDCLRNADRIVKTFTSRDGNTGVLLTGEKGSGKTLLARQIAIQSGLPVIIVNSDHSGDNFNSFLSSITQPCIVFLDEFEKTYNRESQEKILTLLDGTYQSRKLFLLTSNDKFRIDNNMKNRPGRIFYLIEFGGLEEEFIVEYCQDNLKDQSYVPDVVRVSRLFDIFNFDLLTAIVEESNRYGENPKDLLGLLNAKPEYGGEVSYSAVVKILDTIVPPGSVSSETYVLNPTTEDFEPEVWFAIRTDNPHHEEIEKKLEYGEPNWDEIHSLLKSGDIAFYNVRKVGSGPFGAGVKYTRHRLEIVGEPADIVQYTPSGGMIYRIEGGVSVTLERVKDRKFNRPSM
jgi:ATPases of the AAA+ class